MDTVSVAIRVRPLVPSESDRGSKNIVTKPNNSAQIIISNAGNKHDMFTYNYAFSADDSQEMVYANAVQPIVARIFDGYNATILAYGQTGSGKTHTMGTTFDGTANEDVGVIPRAVAEIFETIENMPEYTFNVRCSFMELYQEQLYDLLATTTRERSVVDIREDNVRGIFVSNLLEVPTATAQAAIQCLIKGSAGRAVGATAMNATSSRSHAIFTINIQKTSLKNADNSTDAKFHLVDLAGSERSKKTKATGSTFLEGVKINQGLLALGNVISALGTTGQNSAYISYRDSKLTRLLQDSLGGNSVTLMIACISPADYNLEETLSTLRYADRARKIRNKPIVNFDPKTAEINKLNAIIQELRMKLLNRNEPPDDERLAIERKQNAATADRLDVVMKSFEELSKKYQLSITTITDLNLKLATLESCNDESVAKLEVLQSKCTDIGSYFGTTNDEPLDVDVGRKLSASLADGVADILQHLNTKIFETNLLLCGTTVIGSCNSEDNESRAIAEEFHNQQIDYQHALRDIQSELALKTLSHKRLTGKYAKHLLFKESSSKIVENTSEDYGAIIHKLEQEKEELQKLVHTKNAKVSMKLSEEQRKRVIALEQEIANVKQKNVLQERLLKQREKDRLKLADLQRDIHAMKQRKVQLIRKMRLESDEYRKRMASTSKEVVRLKDKDRRRDQTMRLKQQLHERQQTILKHKVNEALQSNKRLQEALRKNTIAQAQRQKTIASSGSGRTEHIHSWIDNEIEVIYSVVDAKHALEQLIDDRGEMNIRAAKLSGNNGDRESIATLQEEIDMRTAQIADLQDKIKSSNIEEKIQSICKSLNSMTESKITIKYLFDNLTDLRTKYDTSAMKLRDFRIAQETNEQRRHHSDANLNEKYDTVSRECERLRQERIEVETEYENQVTALLQVLQTIEKGVYNKEDVLQFVEDTLAPFRNKYEPEPKEYEERMQKRRVSSGTVGKCASDEPWLSLPEPEGSHAPFNETITLAVNKTVTLNQNTMLNETVCSVDSNDVSHKRNSEDAPAEFHSTKIMKFSESDLVNMTITQYPYNEKKKRQPLLDMDYSVQK